MPARRRRAGKRAEQQTRRTAEPRRPATRSPTRRAGNSPGPHRGRAPSCGRGGSATATSCRPPPFRRSRPERRVCRTASSATAWPGRQRPAEPAVTRIRRPAAAAPPRACPAAHRPRVCRRTRTGPTPGWRPHRHPKERPRGSRWADCGRPERSSALAAAPAPGADCLHLYQCLPRTWFAVRPLDLQQLAFLVFDQFIDLVDVLVRRLLQVFLGSTDFVFAGLPVLADTVQLLHCLATDV